MIIELSIRNFKSIRDLVVISFAASKTAKLSGNILVRPNRDRFVKAMALYGPNASGKTTVLDALYAIGAFVLFSSQDQKPTTKIPNLESFALDRSCVSQPSELMLTIDLGASRYTIEISATPDRVWREKLTVKRITAQPSRKGRSIVLIDRVWNEDQQQYLTHLSDELGSPTTLLAATEQTPPNRLILGKLASLNSETASHIVAWFDQDLDFYDMHRNPYSEEAMLEETTRMVQQDNRFAELIGSFIRDADVGVSNLHVAEEKAMEPVFSETNRKFELKETTRSGLSFQHFTEDGSEVVFRRRKESSGTLRFVALLTAILKPSPRRRVVCVDELSASLHPDLVRRLLSIVHSREYNSNGNQILFTTHDTHLINPNELLRRDQIIICDKDRFGKTSVMRLDEFQDDARSDANLQKQYLQGRFGGKPQFGPLLEDVLVDDEPLEVNL